MHMSVAEEAIIKVTGRINSVLGFWSALTPPDTIRTGSTLTVTAPIRWIQTGRRV